MGGNWASYAVGELPPLWVRLGAGARPRAAYLSWSAPFFERGLAPGEAVKALARALGFTRQGLERVCG